MVAASVPRQNMLDNIIRVCLGVFRRFNRLVLVIGITGPVISGQRWNGGGIGTHHLDKHVE